MSSHLHILDLPIDVWVMVTQNLSVEELKPWRFTCRSLAALAAPRLFARLSISRLQSDQDKFEQVTRDPVLAAYVKEIVWHEFDSDRLEQFPHFKDPVAEPDEVEDDNLPDAGSTDPVGPVSKSVNSSSIDDSCQTPRWVWDWFEKGIRDLKNLTTITVRMEYGWRKYGKIGQFFEPHLLYDKYGSKSLGVHTALMALYHPSCKVRTLNLATMVPVLGAGAQPLLDRDTQAFQHLTSISICPIPRKKRYNMKDDIFIRCIQAAKQLRNLQLCFPESTTSSSGASITRWNMRFVRTLFNEAHWPCLVSFQMRNYPIFESLFELLNAFEKNIVDLQGLKHDDIGTLNKESIVEYFEKSTTRAIANLGPKLRRLQMHNCLVRYDFFKFLRERQVFPELESIILSHHDPKGSLEPDGDIDPPDSNKSLDVDGFQDPWVSPETVLAYLRMEITEAQFNKSKRLVFVTTKEAMPTCWVCSYSFTLEGYDFEYERDVGEDDREDSDTSEDSDDE